MSAATVAELAGLLEGTGITTLTLTTPDETITLRRQTGGAPAPAPAADTVAAAPCCGVFLHRHPLRNAPLVQPGQAVQAGTVVGLVRAGPLLLHVAAPAAGVVAAMEAPDQAVVGYGTPLVRIEED